MILPSVKGLIHVSLGIAASGKTEPCRRADVRRTRCTPKALAHQQRATSSSRDAPCVLPSQFIGFGVAAPRPMALREMN